MSLTIVSLNMINSTFKTPEKHGYAIEFSPYHPQRLACVACQHFGIVGRGALYVLDLTPQGIHIVETFDWNDGLFDVTWSENNERLCVTASGDGSIQLWDISLKQGPLRVWKEHSKEAYSVDWSQSRDMHVVLSGSWDRTIKLWDLSRDSSMATFQGHEGVVYGAVWSPRVAGCFASASGDQTVRVWDIRKSYMAQIVLPAHQSEVLCCDFSKYDPFILISGATDGSIRLFDLRNPRMHFLQLQGHSYAVRRVKFSPFDGPVVASASYDFTVRTWDYKRSQTCLETIEHHTEFVYGLDFNLHVPGQIADCSWDTFIQVYSPASLSQYQR